MQGLRMTRLLLAAAVAAMVPGGVAGQAGQVRAVTVHGRVRDAQTGAPIAGAVIVVSGSGVGTTTDEAGVFTLRVSAGATLEVSSVGYVERSVPVGDVGVEQDIELTPSAVQLPGIEVSTVRPSSVGVLTERDLERGGGLRLEPALNTLPGVFMQSRSPWGGARITIRGYYPSTGNSANFNHQGSRIYLNGIPLTDATGTTILDGVDYASLGVVEVVKGPVPSRGSNIGGAVLLTVARPAPGERWFEQGVVSGSDGLLRTNTSYRAASENADVSVNYGYQDYDSFRPHSRSRKHFMRAAGDFKATATQTLSAFFAYDRSFEELAGEIDSTNFHEGRPQSNPAYLAMNAHIDIRDFMVGVTHRIRLGDWLTNETTLYGTGRSMNQPFAHGFTDTNQFTFGARTSFGYSGRLGTDVGVTGEAGAELQRTNLMSDGVFIGPAPPFPRRPGVQENFATNATFYTEWRFGLPGGMRVVAGGSLVKNRFGVHDLLRDGQVHDSTRTVTRTFDAEFSPRIAVSKELGPSGSVFASVSKGYTPPLLSNVVASDGTVNYALDPERAVQYEVGAQGTIFDGRLAGQLTLFDLENTDKLITQTENAVRFVTNAGKQRNRGVELALSLRAYADDQGPISLVRPWLTYTYLDAEFVDFRSDNDNTANTVDYSGNAVPRVPRHAASAGLDLALRTGLYGNATWQWVDEVPVTLDNSTWIDGYSLLGARAGYRHLLGDRFQLDASIGADNLTSSRWYSFLFIGPNYEGLATPAAGGHGDGYIIPGSYDPTWYASISLAIRP